MIDTAMEPIYEQMAHEILLMQSNLNKSQLLIGIAGPPGVGKSTTSRRLKQLVADSEILSMDGYHFYRKQLEQFDNPEEAFLRRGAPWTFDAVQFVTDLTNLKVTGFGSFPSFDHGAGDPKEDDISITMEHKVVFVEGNYLLLSEEPWCFVKDLLDSSYFITSDLTTIEDRIIKRHMSVGRSKEVAIDRFQRNDSLNAQLILASAERADQIIQTR